MCFIAQITRGNVKIHRDIDSLYPPTGTKTGPTTILDTSPESFDTVLNGSVIGGR